MSGELKLKKTVLGEKEMRRIIRRMAAEILERNGTTDEIVLVGIRTRGVPLAVRLGRELEQLGGDEIPIGSLDITLYRDDLSTIGPQPVLKETSLPGPIEGRVLVLCDDVLFTGRTVRAALNELIDYGRPEAVQLAVLVDRGGRELPIQADFVGRVVKAEEGELIEVHFEDTDDEDRVTLMEVVSADD
ncbi:MAG: bifunctional pyr operon transcriptional regulator/uracil phosphoribosyltransferase PyrR [Acidobacteriota bacterium]